MKDLICIQTYTNRTNAEFAKVRLEGNGIESVVSADDCGGMDLYLALGSGGVRLLVKKEDVQKAMDILDIQGM